MRCSFSSKEQIDGARIIIQNWEGERMTTLCMKQRYDINQPVVAEIKVVWRVMKLCQDLGFTNMVFEGDAN